MKLERVEELCLNYLQQASNPLVPASVLLEHCVRDEQCADLTLQGLLDFLRSHELIRVVEGPASTESVDGDTFSEAGIEMGCRAILVSRVPSREELSAMLDEQLNTMTAALTSALAEAAKYGATDSAKPLEVALGRAEALRDKMRELL